MGIDFYMHPMSPPCKSVMITAKYLGIHLNNIFVDMRVGETQSSEYKKVNPLGKVPAIVDDGFYLSESRAIMAYLVNKYAPGSSIYPENPKERAIVDRMLYFDVGTLFKAALEIIIPIFRQGKTLESTPAEKIEAFKKSVELLESFLSQTKYVAGDHLTIADFALLASVAATDFIKFSLSEYPKILEWMKRVKAEIPPSEDIDVATMKKFTETTAV